MTPQPPGRVATRAGLADGDASELAAAGPAGPDLVLAHPGLDGRSKAGSRSAPPSSPGRRPCSASAWTAASRPSPASSSSGGSPAPVSSATAERRAQKLVAASFYLLAPYIAVEAVRALAAGDRAETSIAGLALTAGTAIFEPVLGIAKRRIGARLGSAATAGEGTQNVLCAYLAIAVFTGLGANTLFGAWWLDGIVALGIAGWAVIEGRRAWTGYGCACASQPGQPC